MFELSQLRSFVAVASELHFGRAAKRLHITQPPLSRQIQTLEQTLKVALFNRTSRSVELTSAGRAFLAEARGILQRSEVAMKIAREAAQPSAGTVRVGFAAASTYDYLPRLVRRARTDLPHIELIFEELSSVEQEEALAFGRIDIGVARPVSVHEDFDSACVYRSGFALALPVEHHLAGRRRPQLAQIHREPFIMYSTAGRFMHDVLIGAFRAAGVQPNFVQFMSQAQGIVSLVSTGLGIAIVPEETRNACFDNVVLRPIQLGQSAATEFHVVWRRDNRNPALPSLRQLMLALN
ncbi:LysR family transcriptional regulator (plasmid) [Bosea sp. F3-2]|uniref:LysR family transcriptional regulator n=1 Tax=Bosea sp. F3-2 TaxID=2599640 RepID=UPI0011EE8056|nr:LysR family transcriptional regulator [Bosea sp. F3-2]QEL27378.1 LysR family transcriptional regulator [Bosea sp. F3-2]